ncbi:hypothetical protein [Plantactinospora sp. BB1]|uniref:hypothetical protein n=1 Tax=Plantactinospora sp. BB1 TaxID=2071627 RepID=UPI000D16C087|nr:hypothetical protein [Plantactinospora sp. BB1]AVT38579.1 hypothetical protein C6W10_21445 [Plantactinospora sp. BB1]
MSLVVHGQTVDPTEMLATLATDLDANGIEVLRVDNVVRFTADELRDLSLLAAPLAKWWQQHRPSTAGVVALRFVGPSGVTELSYSRPDLAVEYVRHTIEVESGEPYAPGAAPGPMRRLTAGLIRRGRTGFTASELSIRDEGDILCIALAGRELDDRPRSVQFQAFNPEHDDYDPGDDDGYCLVTDGVPVYGALVALRLTRSTLSLRLTHEAARAWGARSTTLTIKLHLTHQEIEQLRRQLQRLFSFRTAQLSAPTLHLG